MNRTQLLAIARKRGYKGAADLAAVKAYLSEENINITDIDGKAIDLDAAWGKSVTITATDTAEDGETEVETETTTKAAKVEITEAQATEYKALKKAKVEANRGSGVKQISHVLFDGKAFNMGLSAETKAFDLKAARGETILSDSDAALVVGAWGKLAMHRGLGDFEGKALCEEICTKANVSYDFASGGFVVPEILRNTLISIRPRYSALAQLLGETPISIAGESIPRRASGVTVYSPAQGAAATESNVAGDQVLLTPFEMVALSTVSKTQLMASIISFGEFVANEMNYAIQKKLEEIYILGIGGSTYFNQIGLLGKLSAQVVAAAGTWTVGTNATNAEYHSAVVRGSGNLWSELTDTDTSAMLATPADVENSGSLKWLCHRSFYYSTLVRIARSKGGVPQSDIINGVNTPIFEGLPVVFSNAMPAVQANGQVCLYLGEYDTCTKVGNVPSSMEISTTVERYWELRKVGYQIATHKAVNCHDLGTANSTKPAQTTPFAALVTAES